MQELPVSDLSCLTELEAADAIMRHASRCLRYLRHPVCRLTYLRHLVATVFGNRDSDARCRIRSFGFKR